MSLAGFLLCPRGAGARVTAEQTGDSWKSRAIVPPPPLEVTCMLSTAQLSGPRMSVGPRRWGSCPAQLPQ